MAVRMGIDTGGTFTDLIGIDEATNELVIAKTPSTPRQPAQAVMNAIESCGVPAAAISALSIGTTVAANALLQRRGANVIYVTTRGFEDIPYIQRMNRKYHFSLKWRKPTPLVERRNCLGIAERLDFHGRVLVALEESALEELARQIEARLPNYPAGSVAIAVCLLFSYVNADHELRVRQFLRARFPDIPVSLSHEVAPIWREYERGSTVIADSYVKPVIQDYVDSTRRGLAAERLEMPWALMKSNGGRTTPELAEAEPIQLLLSGLAGGLIAGHYFGHLVGLDNLVTLDMGGTSCDVGLIRGGTIGYSTNFEIEFGLPVATPTIDLTTIGAGGGSIAWIDKGGLLRVGPQSAGAEPGPVCYDTGGAEVTVTDANLVLGRLNPDYFLGGKIALNLAKAGAAVARLGERLGLDRHAAAQAVLDIANENMANAIRVLSIDRGLDPREFALVAFGGAGPLHACDIAAKVGMTQVVVPIYPGLTSAFGALIAAPKVNKVWSKHFRSDFDRCGDGRRAFRGPGRRRARRAARRGLCRSGTSGALDQHALLGPELRAGRADAGRPGDQRAPAADLRGVPSPARAVLWLRHRRRDHRADPLQRRGHGRPGAARAAVTARGRPDEPGTGDPPGLLPGPRPARLPDRSAPRAARRLSG